MKLISLRLRITHPVPAFAEAATCAFRETGRSFSQRGKEQEPELDRGTRKLLAELVLHHEPHASQVVPSVREMSGRRTFVISVLALGVFVCSDA